MDNYLHRVLGLYATRAEAESTRDKLVEAGLPLDKVSILEPGQGSGALEGKADSDDVLREVLREGAIGSAIGTLIGAAGTIALAAANITLLIASPVVGTLSMLGWGATLGGTVGAAMGAQRSKGDVSDLVKDSLAKGHVVLIAHAASEQQTAIARKMIGVSMGEAGDLQPPRP